VGVYGVISYSTAQRTQEIGIRMALGAHPRSILWMVLRSGAQTVTVGMVLGLLGAAAFGHAAKNFLIVSPYDPLTYAIVMLLLAAIAMTACLIPANRGTKVDPMIALRYE